METEFVHATPPISLRRHRYRAAYWLSCAGVPQSSYRVIMLLLNRRNFVACNNIIDNVVGIIHGSNSSKHFDSKLFN